MITEKSPEDASANERDERLNGKTTEGKDRGEGIGKGRGGCTVRPGCGDRSTAYQTRGKGKDDGGRREWGGPEM